ncbi:hypothetical protein [Cohnella kolymensis]|uniref:hypothetical protein n=1 Tax=Cohnella kolymensis TaxID=1590652 RepID=UPI000A6744AA|nr:hypothetical protein [Cohnella kolymensis]
MKDLVILLIWLLGVFGLIGVVIAAVARLVRRDSTAHDKQFLWHVYPDYKEDRNK